MGFFFFVAVFVLGISSHYEHHVYKKIICREKCPICNKNVSLVYDGRDDDLYIKCKNCKLKSALNY